LELYARKSVSGMLSVDVFYERNQRQFSDFLKTGYMEFLLFESFDEISRNN